MSGMSLSCQCPGICEAFGQTISVHRLAHSINPTVMIMTEANASYVAANPFLSLLMIQTEAW
jgi:hypothetical protein